MGGVSRRSGIWGGGREDEIEIKKIWELGACLKTSHVWERHTERSEGGENKKPDSWRLVHGRGLAGEAICVGRWEGGENREKKDPDLGV
jgi:hypothetical protein